MIGRSIFGVSLFSVILAIVDILLIRWWFLGDLSTLVVLAAHGAATLLIGAIALARGGGERIRTAGALLICLLVGPVGGLVLVIVDLGRDDAPSPLAETGNTVRPQSRAEALHAQIRQGRRRHSRGAPPDAFSDVFAAGDLAQQQTAIAAISRDYRPEMLPALRLALASKTPAVRVQAAAVYAKLRGSFGERAKSVRAALAAGKLSPDVIAEARAVAESGFVDAQTETELRAQAKTRPVRTKARPAPVQPEEAHTRLVRPPRLKRHSCGGVA